jgi:hypothetical protein
MLPEWRINQVTRLSAGDLTLTPVPATAPMAAQ